MSGAGVPVWSPQLELQDAFTTTLAEALDGATEVAMLGFPLHPNAGDSLLWLGQLAVLRRLGVRVGHVGDARDHRLERLRSMPDDVVVLLHGGGNFGDLWPQHQQYRQEVLRLLPGHRVVQLPQTLCFRRATSVETCRQALEAHPDVTLLWRDDTSYKAAVELFPGTPSRLCPDASVGIDPLPRARRGTGILRLARSDLEGGALAPVSEDGVLDADWSVGTPGRVVRRAAYGFLETARGRQRLLDGSVGRAAHAAAYRVWAEVAVRSAVDQLSRHAVVVTDRLHAHVLCSMLGIPHVVLDTGFGKIRPIVETWDPGSLGVFASSPADALRRARHLLRALG